MGLSAQNIYTHGQKPPGFIRLTLVLNLFSTGKYPSGCISKPQEGKAKWSCWSWVNLQMEPRGNTGQGIATHTGFRYFFPTVHCPIMAISKFTPAPLWKIRWGQAYFGLAWRTKPPIEPMLSQEVLTFKLQFSVKPECCWILCGGLLGTYR